MLDHIFLTVSDIDRAIAFYSQALTPLGITGRLKYDGGNGPAGHPDLEGFGADGRMFFWLRKGLPAPGAVHIGFAADSRRKVNQAYHAAPPPAPRPFMFPAHSFIMTLSITPHRLPTRTDTALSLSISAGSTNEKINDLWRQRLHRAADNILPGAHGAECQSISIAFSKRDHGD